jgi:hypothetical protein
MQKCSFEMSEQIISLPFVYAAENKHCFIQSHRFQSWFVARSLQVLQSNEYKQIEYPLRW